jgi:pyruvate dehydrogenase E1 component
MTLGCDGFGRSEVRPMLRRFFEIDAECTAIACLYKLASQGALPQSAVAEAIQKLGVDPEKRYGVCV